MYVLLLVAFSAIDGLMIQSMSISPTAEVCQKELDTLNNIIEYDRSKGKLSDWTDLTLRCQYVERVQTQTNQKKSGMYF